MRIPLLIGADPRTVETSQLISLPAGRWSVALEGVEDSELVLWCYAHRHSVPATVKLNGATCLNGGIKVRVVIARPGSEEYISVFMEETK